MNFLPTHFNLYQQTHAHTHLHTLTLCLNHRANELMLCAFKLHITFRQHPTQQTQLFYIPTIPTICRHTPSSECESEMIRCRVAYTSNYINVHARCVSLFFIILSVYDCFYHILFIYRHLYLLKLRFKLPTYKMHTLCTNLSRYSQCAHTVTNNHTHKNAN